MILLGVLVHLYGTLFQQPVLQASPVVLALLVLEVLPVVQVRFGVVHLGRKLLQVLI